MCMCLHVYVCMCMLYVCVCHCCVRQVGKAQHIQFDPLRAHPVTIPAGGVCVVANSLVEASKVGCLAKACLQLKVVVCVIVGCACWPAV